MVSFGIYIRGNDNWRNSTQGERVILEVFGVHPYTPLFLIQLSPPPFLFQHAVFHSRGLAYETGKIVLNL